MTNAEARFNNSLRPRKPEGSLGRTSQDGHLDSHTAPELYLQKYGIGGPKFGVKEEFVTEKGKAALPCPCHEQGGLLSTARPTDRR